MKKKKDQPEVLFEIRDEWVTLRANRKHIRSVALLVILAFGLVLVALAMLLPEGRVQVVASFLTIVELLLTALASRPNG